MASANTSSGKISMEESGKEKQQSAWGSVGESPSSGPSMSADRKPINNERGLGSEARTAASNKPVLGSG